MTSNALVKSTNKTLIIFCELSEARNNSCIIFKRALCSWAIRAQPTSRRAPTVLGRSRISASKVVATKPIRKKSVFLHRQPGNILHGWRHYDIRYQGTVNRGAFMFWGYRPRRRRQDRKPVITRKAFRLCICEDDRTRTRLLDPTVWPDSITIFDWLFKSQSEVDKRPRLDVNPAVAASSGSTPFVHTEYTTVVQSDLQQQQQQQRRYQAQLIKKTQPVMRQSCLRVWITWAMAASNVTVDFENIVI